MEKACSGVPAGVRPSERPPTPRTLCSGAHRPLRGRPAGAGKRRGLRARARRCEMLRGACGRTHVDSGAQRPAAPRPAASRLRRLGAGVPVSSRGLAGVVGSARIQGRSPPRAARSRLSKLGAPREPVRPAVTGPRRPGDPRWLHSPLARDGRQVAPK